MRVLTTIAETRGALDDARRDGRTIGLVPTMGYLHDGHRSLMARSVSERDLTLVTVFVNPLQFGANEDLASYPRDFERDAEMCREAGVDIVLHPALDEMYPAGLPLLTTVAVDEVSGTMEGASRRHLLRARSEFGMRPRDTRPPGSERMAD